MTKFIKKMNKIGVFAGFYGFFAKKRPFN